MSTPQATGVTADVPRILGTIRARESGNGDPKGDYTAKNPNSSASGAYQIIDSTWAGFGGYRRAVDAPPLVQDAKATAMVTSYLARYGGKIEAVPATWYVGHYDPSNLDYVPDGGNKLTVRQYITDWMGTYNGSAVTAAGGGGGLGIDLPALPFGLGGDGVPSIPGTSVDDRLGELADFFGLITDPKTWLRVQAFAAGVGLVVLGVVVILSESNQLRAVGLAATEGATSAL